MRVGVIKDVHLTHVAVQAISAEGQFDLVEREAFELDCAETVVVASCGDVVLRIREVCVDFLSALTVQFGTCT